MSLASWQVLDGRLRNLGASTLELAAIQAAYFGMTDAERTALDTLAAGLAAADLEVMLNTWRTSHHPFQSGFPGGGLPFGTGVAVLTGDPADDDYAIGAGTGVRVSVVRSRSPLAFGAQLGGADDATAIQLAIDWAQQNDGVECLIDAAFVSDAELTYDMAKPLSMRWMPGGSIRWPTDLGAGKYAIKSTGTPGDKISAQFTDARMYGPGDGHATTDGVAPAAMHGLQLGPSAGLYGEFYIGGFWAGYTFNGDHQVVLGTPGKSWRNYVGEYFEPNPYGGNIGDQHVEAVSLANNTLCGTRVACSTNPMLGGVHHDVHYGFGPFCFWLERGDEPIIGVSIGGGIEFHRLYLENVGNAFMSCDDGGIEGDGTNTINGTVWRDIAGYRRADHTVTSLPEFPGRTIYANRNIYNIGVLDDTEFDYAPAFHNTDVTLHSLVHASTVYRLKWKRAQSAINAAIGANVPLFEALTPQAVLLEGASGELYQVLIASDVFIQQYQLLSSDGMAGGGLLAEQVKRYVYAAGPPVSDPAVCVIAMQAPVSAALGMHNIICLRKGVVPFVPIQPGATFAAGEYATPSRTTIGALAPGTGLQSIGYLLGPENIAPHTGTVPLYFDPSYVSGAVDGGTP